MFALPEDVELSSVGQSLLRHPDLFPAQTHCTAERDLGCRLIRTPEPSVVGSNLTREHVPARVSRPSSVKDQGE